MQIFETKLGILFLQVLLSGIMFTTVITCVQAIHQIENEYRPRGYELSKDVVPRYYNISIVFIIFTPEVSHFQAKCEIDIEILKETGNINLHSHDTITLEEETIKLSMKNDKAYDRINSKYYSHENILDLYFEDQLSPGNYTLFMSYKKNINKDIEEGYLNILFQPEARNQQYRLLATNIQSIEARQWFPCWDEPEFKATFLIRFNHEMKYKIWPTLSPASYVQDNYNENWMWTNYVIENSISTYQVMFALTDLDLRLSGEEYIFHPTISKDLFSPIWTRPVMKQFMNLSGVVIAQILESDWYRKIPKTVMSIDHLAIPTMQDDVIAKGRIILYKESLVTFDEKGDSRDHKWEVVSTLARGMAYQAIDNAITLSKWSDLWFKTGLAALLHVEILNEIFPKWRFLDLFVVQVQQDCLRLDTDSTMKPLSYKVRTPSKIKSLFSFPIYVKAPVILRMTQHIMGKDRFQEIIKNYTKVESPTDLWDMQVKITDRGIGIGDPALKDVMATRITESNYPLIHVHRTDDLLAISQDQEQYNIGYYRKRAPSHLILITFTTWQQLDFTNTTPHKWIIPDPYSEILVPLSDKDGWIIVN